MEEITGAAAPASASASAGASADRSSKGGGGAARRDVFDDFVLKPLPRANLQVGGRVEVLISARPQASVDPTYENLGATSRKGS